MASPQFLKFRQKAQPLAARQADAVDATLRPVAEALCRTPIMGAAPPPWIPHALSTGFANAGAPLAVAAFHVDALGYLHSKGSLTCAAGCAAGTTIATIPIGTRPSETLRLAVPVTPGAQWVTVAPTGIIATAFVIGAGAQIDLAFSFLVEQ